jgi:hypothetical protein
MAETAKTAEQTLMGTCVSQCMNKILRIRENQDTNSDLISWQLEAKVNQKSAKLV